jgi:hypothetical protein
MGMKPRVSPGKGRETAVVLWHLMTDEQLEQVLRNVADELQKRRHLRDRQGAPR